MTKLSVLANASKHLFNLISGIYVLSVVARLLGRLWPEAQLPAFVLLSLGFVLTSISMILRDRNGGEDSTASMVIAAIPVMTIGTAVAIGLGKLTARFWSDGPMLAIIWSIVFCVTGVATVIRDSYYKRKLDADLRQGAKVHDHDNVI